MKHDITISSPKIMEFLSDPSRHELRINDNDDSRWSYLFIRSAIDDETDFLYMLRGYGEDGDPRKIDTAPEFAGVYSRLRRVIVSPCYSLRDLVECEHTSSISYEVEAVQKRASQIVCETASLGPVPVTDEAETQRDDEEDFTKYYLDREARECFMAGTIPQFTAHVEVRDYHEASAAARIINHPEDAAQEYARRYIIRNARNINTRLSRLPRIILRLAQLTSTPGAHHLSRAIASSVHDEKMVRVDVDKDGKQLTVRIEARVLKSVDSSYYSTYCMDAPSRKAFESTFGRHADLHPQDVARIIYGSKTLYDRASVSQSEALELSPDQFAMACQAV